MWNTSYGDRVLTPAEAALFVEAVAYMRDMISVAVELQESHHVGVAAFDRLQPTQQLTALHLVTMALLNPDISPPPLSATLEGTVYGVFKDLVGLIEVEIDACRDDEISFELRNAILAARRAGVVSDVDWHQPSEEEIANLPDCSCTEVDRWEQEIETLADQILWDRDFELESLIADQDPSKVADIKEYLGIDRDYFSTAAPDANSEEYLRLDKELVDLRKTTPTLYK
ncbi:hypothetical protein N9Y42_04430 [Mariniblastus sp.]|nr:hypothetical protein [Mariniblastus sp.]